MEGREFVEGSLHAINCMWIFANLRIVVLYKLSKILLISLFKHNFILVIWFLIIWLFLLLCRLPLLLLIRIPLIFVLFFIFILQLDQVHIRIGQVRHFMGVIGGITSNILQRFVLISIKTVLGLIIYLQRISDFFQFILLMRTLQTILMFATLLFIIFIILYRSTIVFCVCISSLYVYQLVFPLLKFFY